MAIGKHDANIYQHKIIRNMLHYHVLLSDPHGHYIDVKLQLTLPQDTCKHLKLDSNAVTFWLPTWIPGSYLIREFSRNIIEFSAHLDGQACEITKPNKNKWQVHLLGEGAAQSNELECTWRVYCWDLSVRSAHFDQTHAFFNGTSLFVVPHGLEDMPVRVTLNRPRSIVEPVQPPWNVATGLDLVERREQSELDRSNLSLETACPALPIGGSLTYQAPNYDSLIDHPFEMGELKLAEFEVCGIKHFFAVYGADPDIDLVRICEDLKPVCEAQIELFEPAEKATPFKAYWFLLHATDSGYGGLEHRNSTALLCSRKDLPQRGVAKAPDDYQQFLGLCSHEYFHSWNIKRIKPEAFLPYNLNQENYTQLLWVFEGFTSYYDDLMLARAGVVTENAYLKTLGKIIKRVLSGPGQSIQSVTESSFEAWTKFYRQDENAPNAIVSYYTKGALIALCLDLTIRERTQGSKSLDDVMRTLWQDYGKVSRGIGEAEMPEIIERTTGLNLESEITRWTETTEPLPLEELLNNIDCELIADKGGCQCSLGIKGSFSAEGMKVKTVINGSAAHRAGVSSGDILVSIGQRKLTEERLKRFQQSATADQPVQLVGFRADQLIVYRLLTDEAEVDEWRIEPKQDSNSIKPWAAAGDYDEPLARVVNSEG